MKHRKNSNSGLMILLLIMWLSTIISAWHALWVDFRAIKLYYYTDNYFFLLYFAYGAMFILFPIEQWVFRSQKNNHKAVLYRASIVILPILAIIFLQILIVQQVIYIS